MQFRRSLPGKGNIDFYFTDPEIGGLSEEQQLFLANLIMYYLRKYPQLKVNAVWDFGIEEGDPARGEKYGDFAKSRDNAVFNAQLLTISFNHARLRRMPNEPNFRDIHNAIEYYWGHSDLTEKALAMQAELLREGVPWPQIENMIRDKLGIVPQAENGLSVMDPYFADVQAIRMMENSESIRRLVIHEIGHMLSEETGAIDNKKIRNLFGKCRDGFENIYEFCAECFMTAELTDAIGLANEYISTLQSVI